MPREQRLETGSAWVELSTTAADWKAADPALLGTMLAELHLIRAFEETVLELAGEGLVHGPAHSSIGQEGGAVGSIVGLRSTDAVNGSHRGHHQFLAKALTHVSGGVIDPAALVTPKIQRVLQRTLAEILGLAQGFCRGRGGSMHLQWFEAGALGTNAIVGGGVPMATGNAWAQKHCGTTRSHDQLLRRRGQPDRLRARIDEPRRGLEAAVLLLHREQPVRRVDPRRRDHRRSSVLGARSGVRHSRLARRRHGPAGGAPGHGAGGQRMRSGNGPGGRRSRGVPVLPPERALPGQRFRLPRQGRGSAVARARPARPGRARDDRARPDRREQGGVGAPTGAGRDDGRRGRAARGRPRQGRQASHPATVVARPRLRQRRRAR